MPSSVFKIALSRTPYGYPQMFPARSVAAHGSARKLSGAGSDSNEPSGHLMFGSPGVKSHQRLMRMFRCTL